MAETRAYSLSDVISDDKLTAFNRAVESRRGMYIMLSELYDKNPVGFLQACAKIFGDKEGSRLASEFLSPGGKP